MGCPVPPERTLATFCPRAFCEVVETERPPLEVREVRLPRWELRLSCFFFAMTCKIVHSKISQRGNRTDKNKGRQGGGDPRRPEAYQSV